MANNHGGAGAKFVSVNLNKLYGQPSHHNYPPHGGSYGPGVGANRARLGGHASAGGGMVVLSRNRPLQKAVPKLSVPPPLNLPSLRKEYEKIDSSGAGGGVTGGTGSGSGSRPTSSGMGWTKPGHVALQEKEGGGDTQVTECVNHTDGVATKGSGTYMPPSARFGGGLGHGDTASAHHSNVAPLEKAVVLRGEDFPSLRAALPSSTGPAQKLKEGSFQKLKQLVSEESSNDPRDSSHFSSPAHIQSSHRIANDVNENGGRSQRSSSAHVDHARKQEDPLPLIWLNPRSDWADDERDTGHGFAGRSGRDQELPKSELYWEGDFDVPRSSILPHKAPNNLSERRGQHMGNIAKGSSSEFLKTDPYRRDINLHSREDRESNSWRNSSIHKDRSNASQVINDGNDVAVPVSLSNSKYMSSLGDNAHHSVVTGSRDPAYVRRDMGQGRQGGQHHWNHSAESPRYRGEGYQNSAVSKSVYSLGGKGLPMNDPLLNFSREKSSFSKSERTFLDDPYQKDFTSSVYDERDPFTGNLVGVVKRKKEVIKQTDFHDPVRESFEAELERVQKMQEMERQRIVEEQERALEQARREDEERRRVIMEEEEKRRRMEEEAREAAWRAEQERLEAIQKAEEQKIAREEEKRRILLEEERRKQAAKQKLLELEAKIAKREAEVGKSGTCDNTAADKEVPFGGKDNDVSMDSDFDNWEVSQRMLERITTSASSDSSAMDRPFDRPQFSREVSSNFVDRGKSVNPWKRDAFEVGSNSSFLLYDQENGHHSPRQEASIGGRSFSRKEFYGGGGYMSSRSPFKGGMQEPDTNGFPHLGDRRWNSFGDREPYGRNRDIESEFYDNVAEKYGGVGWGQGHSRGDTRAPYSERLYMNSESDELYSYGRSRYSMKQPRVLPPPSLTPVPKSSVRGENELSAPSSSLESTARTGNYGGPQDKLEQSDIVDVQQEIMAQKLDKNATLRCDSQSSLSVSSPPSSPTHLSHDELDDSAGCSVIPTAAEGKEMLLSGSERETMNDETGEVTTMAALKSVSSDEDEEWSLENHDEIQEQEEYDEDDDGYGEEDEVHEGADENINLSQEFEHMHLEEKSTTNVMDNVVLGFNEGVEVRIPGDEFERDSKTGGNMIETPEVPAGVVEKQGSVDAVSHEPEKAIEDSVVQLQNAHKSTPSNLLDDMSASSGPSAQHTAPSSVEMASHSSSGLSTMPALSSVPSQADLPVKLQFGLFSGPSLIPSPVPAIQIGSIQMPLHLHPPVGPSIGHIHPSQPPLFQFGQLRYTSPASQGILPMTLQPMSLVQPNIHHAHYNLNQNSGSSLPGQFSQENSAINMKKDGSSSVLLNNQSGIVSTLPDPSHESWSRGLTVRGNAEYNDMVHNSQNNPSPVADDRIASKPSTQTEEKGHHTADNGSEAQLQFAPASSQGLSVEKDVPLSKAPGPSSANRGKKTAYPARNSGPRSFQAYEASHSGYSEFQRKHRRPIQRTEFRVRENAERRQTLGMGSNTSGLDDKLNNKGTGTSTRSGYRRHMVSTKSLKRVFVREGSTAALSSSQEVTSESRTGNETARQTPTKTQATSHPLEGNLKRNISEEDVDAPLQSGVVRVFKQPGIECPSDEDDFIEVRSKRQMLNDRREQREKEIKAKSRSTKQPRKSRASIQGTVVSVDTNKISASLVGEASNNVRSDFVGSEGQGLVNKELSTDCSTMASQPLAPIGTPAVETDVQTGIRSHTSKTLQRGPVPAISSAAEDLGSNLMFETESKVIDNVQTSLGDWGNARIDQQDIPLTQTQLDEAMKPARFNTRHVTSIGDHSPLVSEPILPSSLILTKGKSISSSSSPVNSLLAGEKIQFGAVTSPTVLPPSSRVVSHGIGAPGSFRPDISQISKAENDCGIFFKKDEHSSESCGLTEDCEAEVEAAASAVAVAAIDTDEILGNGLGPVSVSGTKSFGGAGLAGDQQPGSQSKPEESLSVSLPADLSVETPPISLWPPLPSPQSSTQMLSHFPGAPPSHFPFYEMNHPMMSGPVFAFGPHEESSGTQSQSQKSTGSGSRHIGAWQNRSGMDSFYGPPAGFTGPFVGSPGGIPGVQAPPHMLVYNHYAPVGQFGQVGLSFMGATYIPSGKQPDWKHDPASSASGRGEEDMNSMNVVSGQRNPHNMPPPIQHLAPGSPLLPMGSPLTTFDVPPFQTAPDMSVQARWSHVPASPLHAVPMSLPLQQQAEGVPVPSQFSSHGGHPVDQSSFTPNRFSEPQASKPSDNNGLVFPVARDSAVTQFPDELGLVESSGPTISTISAPVTVSHVSPGTTKTADTVQRGGVGVSINNNNGDNRVETTNVFKNQHHQQGKHSSSQQHNHSAGVGGYGYQRGAGASPKNKSVGQWSHHRTGFHGRYQSMGAEKSFPSSTKVKQIYVAKQPAPGGSSSTAG